MASPFRTFRKNQKVWMVVLTILAMFSFVFISNTSKFVGGGSSNGPTDPEVFTWKYGTVHQSDVQSRMSMRKRAQEFLIQAGKAAGIGSEMQIRMAVMQRFPVSEPAAIESMLLDKKAQQLGIVVSDDMVRHFIRDWTQAKVSRDDLLQIIAGLSASGGFSQSMLFDALRNELSAMYVQQIFAPLKVRGQQDFYWFRGETPAQRWDFYCRLNRKVTAEFMPVSVKDFVDRVKEPTNAELQKFYDQYKNDYSDAARPTPGFKQPYRAQFEYVKADNAKLLDEVRPSITDQEIQEYYDKYKDKQFRKGSLPDVTEGEKSEAEKSATEQSGAAKPDAKADKGDAKADAQKSETKPADAKSDKSASDKKTGDSKATDSKGATKGGEATGAKSDAKSAGPKSGGKADAKAPSTKSGGDKKSADGKQSKNELTPRDSLHGEMLALADDAVLEVAQRTDAAKSGGAKSDTAKKDAKSDSKSDTKSVAPPAESKSDTKATDVKPADTKDDAKSMDAKSADSSDRPVEYEPLEKVKDKIRDQIAQQKVDEKVAEAFAKIQGQMERYGNQVSNYNEQVAAGNISAKKPQPLDLEALAKQSGFQFKKTDLVSWTQANSGYDIGKSFQPVSAGNYSSPSFIQVAYQTRQNGESVVKLYQAGQADDVEQNHYLWWKIADEPAVVPSLDAARPEVVSAWKMIKARELAEARAKQDVEQVKKSGQTLKEAFGNEAGVEILSDGPFSWLSRSLDQGLRLTAPKGVEYAGSEFMQALFALRPGQAGVAVNQPKTIYYVVRIDSEEPSPDVLHENFMTAMNDPMTKVMTAAVAAAEQANFNNAWEKELQDEYGFKLAPGHTFSQNFEMD